ncbi:unnamed protein product, partial [Prorocentrum cordatum]
RLAGHDGVRAAPEPAAEPARPGPDMRRRDAEAAHLRARVELLERGAPQEDPGHHVLAALKFKDEEVAASMAAKHKELEMMAGLLQLREQQIEEFRRLCEEQRSEIQQLKDRPQPRRPDGFRRVPPGERAGYELRRASSAIFRRLAQPGGDASLEACPCGHAYTDRRARFCDHPGSSRAGGQRSPCGGRRRAPVKLHIDQLPRWKEPGSDATAAVLASPHADGGSLITQRWCCQVRMVFANFVEALLPNRAHGLADSPSDCASTNAIIASSRGSQGLHFLATSTLLAFPPVASALVLVSRLQGVGITAKGDFVKRFGSVRFEGCSTPPVGPMRPPLAPPAPLQFRDPSPEPPPCAAAGGAASDEEDDLPLQCFAAARGGGPGLGDEESDCVVTFLEPLPDQDFGGGRGGRARRTRRSGRGGAHGSAPAGPAGVLGGGHRLLVRRRPGAHEDALECRRLPGGRGPVSRRRAGGRGAARLVAGLRVGWRAPRGLEDSQE